MILLALVAVVVLVVVNGLFVATEFAVVASRPAVLEEAVRNGLRGAQAARRARGDLRRQLSGAQVLITLSSVLLGILAEPAIGDLVGPVLEGLGLPSSVVSTLSWVVAIGAAAVLQMLVGELVPKNIAIAEPEATLRRLSPMHGVLVRLIAPAIWLLDGLATMAVRLFGQEPVDELEEAIGKPEMVAILAASRREGLIEDFEHDLLAGALDLGRRSVASVMIPRDQVVSVNRQMTVAEVERVVVDSGHSRLPVAASGGNSFLGMIHVKDLLRLPEAAQDEPAPLEAIRRMLVVRRDQSLEATLMDMRASRIHLAAVGGSHGETFGIVSMEDVIEELVGDIHDESDTLHS
ncbi:MAG TPA: hemolysin family protein [Acidimicrobiales bacterium]|jgi:CBS domain containing-hemolysin-like protein|nr:hemolysin family protein [Acidimicrobiales bacterium]MDP6214580.1 hemolysin family protein [Acidimicrobiales bacterium]MDP7208355.1 hemolysin family protein [Acidimicrobiales bacterium]HJL88989.1 hemolysin family protein [Acidimicrobiales bacterium]HJO99783.1 hemolysin family protein [Acidimicrobiales bacterium]|tara:strand:- start:12328 stop:13374 length:1047 start_codon:yes stop_codon:yes gene_type:complete